MYPAPTTHPPHAFVAFDTETHLIQPGLMAPPLVCGSFAWDGGRGMQAQILDAAGTFREFCALLASPVIIVGANIAYDMLVMAVHGARHGVDLMPEIFNAYAAGRVYDVQIAEALHAVALGTLGFDTNTGGTMRDDKGKRTGRYSLYTCTRLVLGRVDAKANDYWRMRYAELEHIPIDAWPADAREYPLDDARNTLEVALAQIGHLPATGRRVPGPNRNLHDVPAQAYAAWALWLGAAWGFAVDEEAARVLEHCASATLDDDANPFLEAGILRYEGDALKVNTTILKRLVAEAYGSIGACPTCYPHELAGLPPGMVPSTKAPKILKDGSPSKAKIKPVRCVACDGTGLELAESVPRTTPSDPTTTPGVGKGRDVLTESGDNTLIAFAGFTEDAKIRTVYVPYLLNEKAKADAEESEDA